MLHPDAARAAAFLEAIPGHDAQAAHYAQLADAAQLKPEAARAFLALLETTGAIATDPAGEEVRARSVIAGYFLRSLAEHVRDGVPVLTNWERAGVQVGLSPAGESISGPRFLFDMERQRLARAPGAPPLRTVQVAQVLVKGRVRGRSRDLYLAHYDPGARQYQLPGGHRRGDDGDLRVTAIRELEEELTGFAYDPAVDSLTELGHAQVPQLSRTYGVNTLYEMTIFQLRTGRTRLGTSPSVRWLTAGDLIDSTSDDFNFTALRQVAATLPGGVADLPLSLKASQSRSLRQVVRENGWEFWGLIIGLLGLILSVVFYVVS